MQRRIARGSIGPSTLRGMGPKGTIERARTYLCMIDLRDFNEVAEEEKIKVEPVRKKPA